MNTRNASNTTWTAGLITAIVASLCCITPVLAILGGIGGIASTFSWLDPFRPYLIGFTVLVFVFAWHQKLKPRPKREIACACETDKKPSFLQTKTFLAIVSVIAALLLFFPSYAGIFFSGSQTVSGSSAGIANLVTTKLFIEGMTCTGCEHSVNHALRSKDGVIEATSSYTEGIAVVKFDKSKITGEQLAKAIEDEIGYKVTKHERLN